MRHRVDELGSKAREAAGELNAHAVDSVQGLKEIVAFQHEQQRGEELHSLGQRHIALRLPFFRQLTLQQSLLEVMTGLGGLAIVAVGGSLAAHGQLEAGILPLLTILSLVGVFAGVGNRPDWSTTGRYPGSDATRVCHPGGKGGGGRWAWCRGA